MYLDHFGLVQNPFTPLSTASGPFRSKELEEALAHFQYARMNRESFFLLVGEVGTGKSTAVRAIVDSLGPEFPVAVLRHTRLDARELLEEVLRQFGVPSRGPSSKSQLLGRLESLLSESALELPAVLILDEAHLLSQAALEEVRLLSNLEKRDRPLLQICLVGQPELLERLRQHELRPLRQRIGVRYVFSNLTRTETREYIRYRLAAAGSAQPAAIFSDDASDAVHELAEGLPREINVVAGQAMVNAYLENAPVVKRRHVRTTKHDYGFEGVRVAQSSAPEPVPVSSPAPVPQPLLRPESQPVAPPLPRPESQPLSRPLSQAMAESLPEPAATDPADLLLEDDDFSIFEEQPTPSRKRTLALTAIVAMGVLAAIALLVYPRDVKSKVVPDAVPRPGPASSTVPKEPPQSESALTPAPEPPPSESAPTPAPEPPQPTTSALPEPEPERERREPPPRIDPAPQAISIAPQPVSRAATAADRLERGTWLARNGSLDEAIAAFREALALEPGYVDALYNLGVTLLDKGELGEAIETLQRATAESPNHGLAQRSLGIALSKSGQLIEAAASLDRAVALLPNDVFALRHLARVLLDSGEVDRAINATRKAVAITPNDAGLQQELGFALRQAGQLAEAATALQRSVEIDGNLAQAHYTLGVTLIDMGNREAGEREIAEARRLGYDPR